MSEYALVLVVVLVVVVESCLEQCPR